MGSGVGSAVGTPVGRPVGDDVGNTVGPEVGVPMGRSVGSPDGTLVGALDGTPVGTPLGCIVGTGVGTTVGGDTSYAAPHRVVPTVACPIINTDVSSVTTCRVSPSRHLSSCVIKPADISVTSYARSPSESRPFNELTIPNNAGRDENTFVKLTEIAWKFTLYNFVSITRFSVHVTAKPVSNSIHAYTSPGSGM